MLTEARTLSIEAASAWDYVNEAQDTINYNSDGTYDFKGVYCTVAAKSIARKFTLRSEGYEMRYVRDNPRSVHDAPDDFESEALGSFAADGVEEYYGIVNDEGGGTTFRYLVPLDAEYNCLQCHGVPVGELDVTGRAKEGMQLGDLAGAVSISIPMGVYEDESRFRVLQAVVFVLVLLVAAVLVVRLALRRLVVGPLERENETLHDEMQSVIVALSPVAKKRNITFKRCFDMEAPLVVSDELALQKIVMNLVGNAVKFSPEDAEVTVVEKAEKGFVVVEVLDRGPGIPDEELDHIFERFSQAGCGAISSSGCGLGLYASASLAKALGAKLEVRNREESGSVFTLRILPMAADAISSESAAADFGQDCE